MIIRLAVKNVARFLADHTSVLNVRDATFRKKDCPSFTGALKVYGGVYETHSATGSLKMPRRKAPRLNDLRTSNRSSITEGCRTIDRFMGSQRARFLLGNRAMPRSTVSGRHGDGFMMMPKFFLPLRAICKGLSNTTCRRCAVSISDGWRSSQGMSKISP